MPYNTGNPIPSSDAKDLSDNAENLDNSVNTALDTWTDRLGVERRTIQGQLKLLGYTAPDVYAGGLVFTVADNMATIERNKIIYAPLPSAIPFTTSGTWTADDEDKFFVAQGLSTENLNEALEESDVVVLAADTVADMKTKDLQSGQIIHTKGYHTNGDSGGATYLIQTATEFGGTPDGFGDHTLANGNVAVLLVSVSTSVAQFGAVGDGVANNDTEFFAAKTNGPSNPYVPEGVFLVSDGYNLDDFWGVGEIITPSGASTTLRSNSDLEPIKSRNNLTPIIYDMQYGAIKGVPWDGVGGIVNYTISSPSSAGSFTVEISGPTPNTSTLLAYTGVDGNWYTTCVRSISGSTVTLRSALEADIDTSSVMSNFYNNTSHPNVNGYNAIADYILRDELKSYKRVSKSSPSEFTPSSTITSNNLISEFSPGGTNVTAWDVATINSGDGCVFNWQPKNSGIFLARLKLNTAFNPTTITTIWNGVNQTVRPYEDSTSSVVTIPLWVPSGLQNGEMRIVVTGVAATSFVVSDIEILEFTGVSIDDMDYGVHVLLGDSWFDIRPGIADRLNVRLPQANIIEQGVGGNTATDLLARFDTSVTPNNPDYVWIMVGTNDYYGGVSVDSFSNSINELIFKIQEIGATPIIITSSVGETQTPSAYDRSREYLADVYYWPVDNSLEENPAFFGKHILIPISAYVPAGSTVAVATLGRYDDELTVYESYVQSGVSLSIDEGASLPASTNIGTIATSYDGTTRNYTVSGTRWVQLNYTAAGSPVNVQGYVIIKPPLNT